MTILQSIILGLIQGITEFLPISSSGHLIFVPEFFGWQDQGLLFDVTVHVATLGAVLYVFHSDVWKMMKGFVGAGKRSDGKLAWMIAFATAPAVIVALFFGDLFETFFRSAEWVAVFLLGWGIVLALADRYAEKRHAKQSDIRKINVKTALFIGVAQAIALLPGTSRSGITISAGLFSGLDRVAAARFSFLLSIPAILGAGVYTLMKALESTETFDIAPLIAGLIAAFASGTLAIRFLLRLVAASNYLWFAGYRVLLALLIIAVLT